MMLKTYDREIFFDAVRGPLFGGSLTQQQVDGMNFKLGEWETKYAEWDMRWLAYALATSKHETASAMWPVEEYGKGAGASYGKPDPKTGWAYYGRGDVQLTWADNYQKATAELGLTGDDDLYWHADRALDPQISADVLFVGMEQGWFRSGNKFAKFFNASKEDPYGAREIINGDKSKVPSWSNGVSIGNLVAGYYANFLKALRLSMIDEPVPAPELPAVSLRLDLRVTIATDGTATTEVLSTTVE